METKKRGKIEGPKGLFGGGWCGRKKGLDEPVQKSFKK